VKVWVILDRPPNDPLLRKKESFTSSKSLQRTGRGESEAGTFVKQEGTWKPVEGHSLSVCFNSPPMGGGYNRGGRV